MKLRPYQKELVNKVRLAVCKGSRAVCCVLGCGGGKSVILANIIASATNQGNRVLFLVHRKELIKQIEGTLAVSGANMECCQCLMVQTASRCVNDMRPPRIIVVDECFAKGTQIATPNGNKNIEDVAVGDVVYCFDEKGVVHLSKVTSCFRKEAKSLLKINGTVCTENHRVFTPLGWKQAKELKVGGYVYGFDVSRMWSSKKRQTRQTVCDLLQKEDGRTKQIDCPTTYERTQSNGRPSHKRENASNVNQNWTLPNYERWKRQGSDSTSTEIIRQTSKCSFGVCNSNRNGERKWLPNLLQGGHSNTKSKNSNRGGWSEPLREKKGARQEERFVLTKIRVESVEIFQQTDNNGLAGSVVYDLEVAKYHTYFANGIAVHNCHHILSTSYMRILERFPEATILGFTATPQRMNEGGLGAVFNELVEGPTTQWLIDNHYLSPFKAYSIPLANTDGLHVKRGEFDPKEVEALMSQGAIFGNAVKEWQRLAQGKKTIIYCASVALSKATTAAFKAAGVTAEHLDGATPTRYRDETVQAFREGKITVLCNVDLFGEGFDVPDCECVVMLRPTSSLTLHIQQSMRSMRYQPGKTALILDHVGNLIRHGLPTEIHEWTLETKRKKKKNLIHVKECPNCLAAVPSNTQVCPYCGYDFTEEQEYKERVQVEAKLEEFTRRPATHWRDLKTLEDLFLFAKAHKYNMFWAAYKAVELGIKFPPKFKWMERRIRRR